jgi:hypothetical protein
LALQTNHLLQNVSVSRALYDSFFLWLLKGTNKRSSERLDEY